ncbi:MULTISPECIES: helix-turn-helix domain-containing protein [Xanthomonas translucens group]|uniref:helix-turn-helix domain-containing protein n=1 Tax=Xanthomonas translucens group TaxID=3390202 RepID=UPI000ABB4B61|nr:helix-turn-helix transcriptional regulator [Xanthomonas translucens]MCT8273371.1 helix-turn-helix transcriptional regulator [Xanthomonas translucens pv. translucens]MCT8277485.1 helix-turn-helix transcriptional regulator [Xanthomonas translucens pv. translucens]MCT8306322.1 helix-turn-helix transcriptional regulator [Xanthomonas translucens pv. translucens]QSQ38914.1 helix-turn-helix transcriptional regulator [Xanthomonas translucens pv. translucens]UII65641.1 helix-turn-helix transcription
MDEVTKICTRLREERVRLGMNQQELADIGGVSRKTQSAYEGGLTAPDVAYLSRVEARGVDVHYVIGGARESAPPTGHVALAAIDGFAPFDGPTTIVLPEFLLAQKVGTLASLTHVRWALNPSRAMEPEIQRQQLALVDVSLSTKEDLIDGNTYAYTLWGRPDIRRVLLRRDHISVVGFGKDAESTDVYAEDKGGLEILGCVVGVL